MLLRKYMLVIALISVAMLALAGCSDSELIGTVSSLDDAPVKFKKDISRAEYDTAYNQLKLAIESQQNIKIDENASDQMAQMAGQLRDKAFDSVVDNYLVENDAAARGVNPDKDKVEAQISQIKASLAQNGQNYQVLLQQMGMTEDDLRNQLQMDSLQTQIIDQLAPDLTVSDQEILDYYNANKEKIDAQGGMQVYHILVSDEALAKQIITEIQNGADFSQMAAKYSTCPSKAQGGDLGVVNESTNFVPEFKAAALALKPGEMTLQPVKTQFGYHVIKAGEMLNGFDSQKDNIRKTILQNKQADVYDTYIAGLRAQAKIEDFRKK